MGDYKVQQKGVRKGEGGREEGNGEWKGKREDQRKRGGKALRFGRGRGGG